MAIAASAMLFYDGSMTLRLPPTRLLMLVLAISTGLWFAILPWLVATLGLDSDFMAFYTIGEVVLRAPIERMYDLRLFLEWQQALVPSVDFPHRFVYVPAYAGVYLPFAAVPLVWSRIGMVILSLITLATAIRLSRYWQSLGYARIVLLLLAFPAIYLPFLVGQNSLITLMLFTTITALMMQGRRPWLTGVVGGLVLYKPQLVIAFVVVWVARRSWQTLIAFGLTGVVTLVASWMLAPAATLQFFGVGQSLLQTSTAVGANVSVYAALSPYVPLPIAQIGTISVSVFVLGALVVTWWRLESPTAYHYALLWLAPLLITPYLAIYDLALVVLPLSLLYPAMRTDRWLQVLVALWWYSPVVNLLAGEIIVLSPWATLALFVFCLWQCRTRPVVSTTLPSVAAS